MKRWEVINAVQHMQDYIDENLNRPITLRDLAKAAGYSQWHSARIFKELTGKSPFEYLRTLRLSKAAVLLRDKQPKVVDVAFDFVFDSHEGFTRAFVKQFGVSPKNTATVLNLSSFLCPIVFVITTLHFKKERLICLRRKQQTLFSYKWWKGHQGK